jgi:hypothetical protein
MRVRYVRTNLGNINIALGFDLVDIAGTIEKSSMLADMLYAYDTGQSDVPTYGF